MQQEDEVAVSSAARMMALFEGFAGAYGTYGTTNHSDLKGGKLEIKASAKTVKSPITLELWEKHLSGEKSLGVIPIRDNDTCLWSAIDVDVYDISYGEMVARVEKENLPLVACRTKSGGVHLYIFFSEPVPAEIVQMRMREIAALLGHGNAEIFPKQTHVHTERGDLGSWLNMPYFGGEDTDRYGLKRGGGAMTFDEFMEHATATRQPRSYFTERHFRRSTETTTENGRKRDPTFGDGPPCMQHLTTMGFPEGTRNKGLFNLGIFAKKKFANNWEDVIEDWNRTFVDPPLPAAEVLQIIKSLQKKDYFYACREHPLSAHCNSVLCRTRRFGVGGDNDYPVISGLRVMKNTPPLWFVDVEGKQLELTTEQLRNYQEFHKVCMEQVFICYKQMKAGDWLQVVATAMRDAVEIETPVEVGNHGKFSELLEEFVTNRHRGDNIEDLLSKRPYWDEEQGRHYFRLRDLEGYLENCGFKIYNRAQMTARIRQMGGDKHFFNVKGKGFNAWWIPAISPVPELSLPKLEHEPI